MRNPWGNSEWKGDWSDDSPLWDTATFKDEVGFTKNEDGIFFMTEWDYIKNFGRTTICMFKDGYIPNC